MNYLRKRKKMLLTKSESLLQLSKPMSLTCSHPNVISYKEAFIDKDDSLCVVMEFAEKGDLEKRIKAKKKKNKMFSENEIWYFFLQLLNGLKALHAANILH